MRDLNIVSLEVNKEADLETALLPYNDTAHADLAEDRQIGHHELQCVQPVISRFSINGMNPKLDEWVSTSFFTHPACLAAGETENLISLSDSAGEKIALFFDCGEYLHHCNRLEEFSVKAINEISEVVFSSTSARFVIIEDAVVNSVATIKLPHFAFSYHENWCRELSPGMQYLSGKRRYELRRRMKKLLAKIHDNDVEYVFKRCSDKDIDAVISLNAKALASHGKEQYFPEDKQRIFKQICAENGYLAALYADGNLIAGEIITIFKDQAYFNVRGYNLDYREFSPGMPAHCMAIDKCIELGCTKANFLWGNSTWKKDVGSTRVPLTTLIICRNTKTWASRRFWSTAMPYLKRTGKQRVKNLVEYFHLI